MQPSLAASGAVLLFGVPTATGRFEKFRLDGRYVDVEQVGCGVLDAIAGRVAMGGVDPNDIKTVIGVRDAIALHGASTLRTWQERTLLTDQLANSEVGRLGGRILSPAALYDLTWARADELSYVARVAPVLLAGLGLLGAVNRQWVSIDDPKWMPWQVDRLAVKPPALMNGFRTALTVPTEDVDRRGGATARARSWILWMNTSREPTHAPPASPSTSARRPTRRMSTRESFTRTQSTATPQGELRSGRP